MISAEKAIEFLQQGKVVAVPTETVYGLAADALNPAAIAKVFEIKNRPADNPLICHFYSEEQIRSYVKEIPVTTQKLMNAFSPGPISFMLDLPENSPLKFAACGNAQVIARIPDHPVFLDLIKKFNHPVAAPSANTSGKVSPTSAGMVQKDLGEKVDGIVDGGASKVGLESTIVDARSEKEILILRHGFIGEKEIHSVSPQAKIIDEKTFQHGTTPGSKYRHYAPDTPIFEAKDFLSVKHERRIAMLLTQQQFNSISELDREKFILQENHLIILGSINDLNELARNFYLYLASVDHLKISKAYLLKNDWGKSSLGKALQQRIEKIVAR